VLFFEFVIVAALEYFAKFCHVVSAMRVSPLTPSLVVSDYDEDVNFNIADSDRIMLIPVLDDDVFVPSQTPPPLPLTSSTSPTSLTSRKSPPSQVLGA
jgi:hypothetical protein